jgi:hypothetical protein
LQHDPRDKSSSPCISPAGQCQSELLGSFRCRALLLPNQLALNDRVGMCYLCHLYTTNVRYIEARDQPDANLLPSYCIHAFNVQVNIVGEYRLDRMLPGIMNTFTGIWGPFPIYNVQNYQAVPNGPGDNLKRWVESDTMVFRLSQAVSH